MPNFKVIVGILLLSALSFATLSKGSEISTLMVIVSYLFTFVAIIIFCRRANLLPIDFKGNLFLWAANKADTPNQLGLFDMVYPLSVFIGLRYLRGRSGDRFSRFVSLMSTAGIVIGVMSLITVSSVMNGFETKLKDRILGVLPQAVVSYQDSMTPIMKGAPDFIRQLSKAQPPEPIVRSEAVLQSPSLLTAGYLIGIDPKLKDPIGQHMIAGSLQGLIPGHYGLLIGRSLAHEMKVSVGDTVRLIVTQASQYTPLGRVPSQRNFVIAGIYDTGSDIDQQLMIANITDVSRLLRLPSGMASGWRIFLNDPFAVTDVAKTPLPSGWRWNDWRDQRGELFQAVKMEKNMMSLMLALIICVAVFNIISALIMVVMEKQSEVAILKTQGILDRAIVFIFVVQGAFSGVVGALLGGAIGVGLSLHLNQFLAWFQVDLSSLGGALPVVINPVYIGVIISSAIGLSLLATLFPAYRASSVKPAEALRYE